MGGEGRDANVEFQIGRCVQPRQQRYDCPAAMREPSPSECASMCAHLFASSAALES